MLKRYELPVDATTDAAIETLLHDARVAHVSFTNLEIVNANDHFAVIVAFDADPLDVIKYADYYDAYHVIDESFGLR